MYTSLTAMVAQDRRQQLIDQAAEYRRAHATRPERTRRPRLGRRFGRRLATA